MGYLHHLMEKEKCTSVLCPNCMDDFPEQTQGKQELSEAPRPVQTARRPVPSHPRLVEGHAEQMEWHWETDKYEHHPAIPELSTSQNTNNAGM